MLPQWPWVVWATTLQFPSNDEAMVDGVEQTVAEAAASAMAQTRLLIMGPPVSGPVGGCLATVGRAAGAFNGLPRELRHNMPPIYAKRRRAAKLGGMRQ